METFVIVFVVVMAWVFSRLWEALARSGSVTRS